MSTLVEELFRQNTWANLRVIEVCEELSEEQLDATAPGTYGEIREILKHILGAQERYVARLSGQTPGQSLEDQASVDFEHLKERVRSTGEALLQFASDAPSDPIEIDFRGTKFRMNPLVILVQVINHSTEHREQVKAILSHLGLEAPNLDGWTYGRSTAGLFEEVTES